MNGAADTPAPPRRRVKWSLQTRLIATVVGMVALILAMIGVATSAILGNILSAQLDNQVQVAVQRVASQIVGWQTNLTGPADAYDVLTKSRLNTSDILLVVKSRITGIDGAYQSGNDKVVSLSDAQVDQIIASFTKDNAQYTTVTIDDVGTYRLFIAGVGNDIIMVGLPLSTVSSTIAQILTTVRPCDHGRPASSCRGHRTRDPLLPPSAARRRGHGHPRRRPTAGIRAT